MALQSAFTLTANEIYNTLANMIISQQVFADNISKHQTLVDKARVDGGLYGDTKLYYATDVLKSVPCKRWKAVRQCRVWQSPASPTTTGLPWPSSSADTDTVSFTYLPSLCLDPRSRSWRRRSDRSLPPPPQNRGRTDNRPPYLHRQELLRYRGGCPPISWRSHGLCSSRSYS